MKILFTRSFCLPITASLLCLQAVSTAQEPAPDAVFKTRSDLVFLPTRVQKKNGATFHGLKAEQFVVEDNGLRQPVQVEASPEDPGFSIVVLIQCSRSAPAEFPNLQGLATMIEGIVGAAKHEVAIVSYGDRPYILGNFSASPAAARYAVSRLKACSDSNAAAIDAVSYANGILGAQNNNYRRAILLIGEMRDHGSHTKLENVVAGLGVSDTVIYSVAFSPVKDEAARSFSNKPGNAVPAPPIGDQPDSPLAAPVPDAAYSESTPQVPLVPEILPLIDALRKNTAAELAELSGGEYFRFSNKRNFDEALLRVSNQIRNYYLLSFKPSPSAATGLHSLSVTIPDSPDAVIQVRKSYWFTPTSTASPR